MDIFRVEGAKLAGHWDVLDVYSLFKQLGAIEQASLLVRSAGSNSTQAECTAQPSEIPS